MRNDIAMNELRCRGPLDQNCVLADNELDLVTGGAELEPVLLAICKAADSFSHWLSGTSHNYGTGTSNTDGSE
jgi:hypothetical protein